ncbi:MULTISPECIES: ABC transporter permease [Bacillota]|uniref:ABC transporter permease n=1 Tax=Bacillota TaxID=1239 RepID=UPI001F55FBBA|nr:MULTISPECIES: ABC transporter permease [Staphylococcus]MCI2760815.1 ABC transporter permease [Staphylococcus lugdunensis]MCI2765613.1 ABC transporter permease [Staphylococcus lugdunensis]MCI2772451.1 ABC transporter permease [Staphylococcus warneri]MCI2785138.1 ABC transporter permease [Staphylococcus warneri]MCI2794961.1 ABC transporter permease [Staphylococcus lugdunensis]
MLKAINLEFFKMRRRKFILPILLITFVGILWFCAIAIKELNITDTKYGIYMLISNILTIDSMIYPILIGILCSRLADIEHQGKTFQLLNTSKQSVFNLFTSKVGVSLIILFVIDIIQLMTILLIANSHNISLKLEIISKFMLSFIIASFFLILIHMSLSFFFEKQSVSIVSALVGSFLGLVTGGMLPSYIKIFLPWQYYSLLNPVHKKMVHKGYEYSNNDYYFIYIFISILLIVILFFIIKALIKRRDLN